MVNNYDNENEASRMRLQKLLNEITEEELEQVIYNEGWTIAVVLGHLAFWDERRALWLKKCLGTGVIPADVEAQDFTNDALVPVLMALHPRKTAELAVSCAEKVDYIINGLSPEWVKKLEGCGDKYAMDRSLHRTMHLNEIDVFLKGVRER